MKRFLSILLSMLIVVSMSVLFAGCGDEASIVGVWEGTEVTDFSNANELMGDDSAGSEMLEYMDLGTYEIDVTYTFKEDGTCSVVADSDDVQEVTEEITTAMMDGLEKYMEALAKSLSMSVDQYAQMAGFDSFEALMDSMSNQIATMAKDSFKLKQEGTYTVSEDKLGIENETMDKTDECTIIELTDTTLKLSAQEGATTIELSRK